MHLSSDNNAVAAGGGGDLLIIGRAARVLIGVSAAGSTAVELDTVTSSGDAISLTRALGVGEIGQRAGGGWGGGVGAAGEGRANGGWWRHGEFVVVVINGGGGEAGSELLNGWCAVVGSQDVLGGGWVDWLWRLDLGDGKGAALGDVGGRFAAGLSSGGGRGVLGGVGLGRALGGRGLGGLLGWNIEDVQNTAGGWLGGGGLGRVVGNVVTIDDIVIPVTLAGLEGGTLESEGTLPGTRLGGGLVLGKRKLTSIVIPGAEEVGGLNTGGCAQRKGQLDG